MLNLIGSALCFGAATFPIDLMLRALDVTLAVILFGLYIKECIG